MNGTPVAVSDSQVHLLSCDGGIVADPPSQAGGEAAIGVVLKGPLVEISEAIGSVTDHHVAEYRALIRGLELARSQGIDNLRVQLDSALVVNQVNGKWKVKAEHLKDLHAKALSLKSKFTDIKVSWVPRKSNDEADGLAGKPLGPLRPKPKPPVEDIPLD